jgi:hypothetical protein
MSQSIQLDFIEQQPFSLTRVSFSGFLMLLIGLLLALSIWQEYQTKQAAYQALLEQQKPVAMIQKKAVSIPAIQPNASENTPAQRVLMRETQAMLNLPWQPLLQGLADANTGDIALLSIEPNVKKKQIGLKGEARNMAVLLRYIDQLEAQSAIAVVVLQNHSINEADPYKPVRFSINAQWLGLLSNHVADAR